MYIYMHIYIYIYVYIYIYTYIYIYIQNIKILIRPTPILICWYAIWLYCFYYCFQSLKNLEKNPVLKSLKKPVLLLVLFLFESLKKNTFKKEVHWRIHRFGLRVIAMIIE